MAKTTSQDYRVNQAAYLARDTAPAIDLVLITHYPDVETLNTVRPGETDLQTALAVNRAVALEMLDAGVEVLVQRADRAAFRRWMSDRDDTPENRRAWIDRGRLLRGSAALEVLGLKASTSTPRQTFGKAPGPIADQLLEAFGDEDSAEFDVLAQGLMAAGRTDVLDLAVRKLWEREGDEAGNDLNWVLLVAAEAAAIGPSAWAELVALVVALPASDVPDGAELGQGSIECGALADSEELRLLPGWRSPDALAELSFGAVRRVLLDLVDGKPPRDQPPGDTDDLARRGFGVLLGLPHRLGHPSLGGDRSRWWPAGGARRGRRGDAGGGTSGCSVRPLARPRLSGKPGLRAAGRGGALSGGERNRGLPRGGWRADGWARGDPGVRRSVSSKSGRR